MTKDENKEVEPSKDEEINYWKWFIKGCGKKSGYRTIFNVWLVLHFIIGIILAFLTTNMHIDFAKLSDALLFPFCGLIISLIFSWGTNMYALLQSRENVLSFKFLRGGIPHQVFVFQTAILIIMITFILWGFSSIGFFEGKITFETSTYFLLPGTLFFIKILSFTLTSLTIHISWSIVKKSNMLLINKIKVEEIINQIETENKEEKEETE